MERVRPITHRGKRILFLDCSNCSPEEVLEVNEKASQAMERQPKHSVLTLVDITGAHFDGKTIESLKRFLVHNKPYVKKSAIVGVSGLQEVVLSSLKRHAKRKLLVFDDLEKAKNWLVKEEKETDEVLSSSRAEM